MSQEFAEVQMQPLAAVPPTSSFCLFVFDNYHNAVGKVPLVTGFDVGLWPPASTEAVGRTQTATTLNRIRPFEFFLWSEVSKQPDFEYIKQRVARAVHLRASELRFETMDGRRLQQRTYVEA